MSHFHLTRAMKTYLAIRSLILDGLDQDAMALVRNMVDTEFNYAYLAQDLTRCQRFMDWQEVERSKFANRRQQAGLDPLHHPDRIAEAHRARQLFRDTYGTEGNSWANKSTDDMARDIGRLEHYISVYTSACQFTHPSFLSFKDYQVVAGGVPFWAPTFKWATAACGFATEALTKIVRLYCGVHGHPHLEVAVREIELNSLVFHHYRGLPTDFFIPVPPQASWTNVDNFPFNPAAINTPKPAGDAP